MDTPRLNAVDMSRWGGEFTLEEASAMKAIGITHVIVGDGHPQGAGLWARQQAEMALSQGMTVDGYIYLYFKADASDQCRQALNTLSGLPIRMWWLDAEDTESNDLSPMERLIFLDKCLDTLKKDQPTFKVGIYTGRWWWIPMVANSDRFSLYPLWNSYYDGNPDDSGLPYGGWTSSAIEQYEGTTNICGQSVDLNYAKNFEVDVTEEQFAAWFEKYMGLLFPAYIEAYFKGEFTARNGQLNPGEAQDSGPVQPWKWQAGVMDVSKDA